MSEVRLPPIRVLDDFLLGSTRLAAPDVRDLQRWHNRVMNNLLYYQSNYLLLLGAGLLLGGSREETAVHDQGKETSQDQQLPCKGPGRDALPAAAAEKDNEDQLEKQSTGQPVGQKGMDEEEAGRYFQPMLILLSCLLICLLFGSFVWAAENKPPVRRFRRNYPGTCFFAILGAAYFLVSLFEGSATFLIFIALPIMLSLIHASLRLRNLKNKIENKIENIGLKRTPMGLLLEAVGQEQEAGS